MGLSPVGRRWAGSSRGVRDLKGRHTIAPVHNNALLASWGLKSICKNLMAAEGIQKDRLHSPKWAVSGAFPQSVCLRKREFGKGGYPCPSLSACPFWSFRGFPPLPHPPTGVPPSPVSHSRLLSSLATGRSGEGRPIDAGTRVAQRLVSRGGGLSILPQRPISASGLRNGPR